MGTTAVCAWIIGDRLYTAAAGDSRLYLLRSGALQRLTTDHTWVQEALDHGALSPEGARDHPNAHVIRRYLGAKHPLRADLRLRLHPDESDAQAEANQGLRLLPGDRLLLCSDGLTDLVEDAEILAALSTDSPTKEALHGLVALANAARRSRQHHHPGRWRCPPSRRRKSCSTPPGGWLCSCWLRPRCSPPWCCLPPWAGTCCAPAARWVLPSPPPPLVPHRPRPRDSARGPHHPPAHPRSPHRHAPAARLPRPDPTPGNLYPLADQYPRAMKLNPGYLNPQSTPRILYRILRCTLRVLRGLWFDYCALYYFASARRRRYTLISTPPITTSPSPLSASPIGSACELAEKLRPSMAVGVDG